MSSVDTERPTRPDPPPSVETRVALAVERGVALLRTDRILQVSLGMFAVQLAFRGYAAYGGFYVLDDYNFIARMGHFGLGPSTAGRIYNGHVMPAGMYLSWFNQVLAPWRWWLPATELLVLQLVADLAMLRLLLVMCGRRPGILPPLALFVFSVISLEGSVWWAAGINALPYEIALLLALTSHLHYLRSGRLRHAWAANGWIAVGLLFYEKSALIYLLIAAVTLCWFAEGYGWRRVASAARGRTPALAVYLGTGAVYVGLYATAGRDFGVGKATTFPTFDVARSLVLHEYLPALVGGPLQWRQFGLFSAAAPGDAVLLASLVVIVLVLNELARHRSRVARALVLPVVFTVANLVLVLLTQRLADDSAFVFDYRFQGEMAAISAIALATMTMPIPGATTSSARRSPSELLDHRARVTALVAVTSALALFSTVGWTRIWHSDTRAQDWVQTVTRSLDDATAPVPLVDRVVPGIVMPAIDRSGGLASRLFVRDRNADFVSVSTDTLRAIDDGGRLLPVVVPALHAAVPGPDPSCGYRIASGPTTISLDGPATGEGLWVRIGYLSTGASAVRVTVGDRTVDTTVQPGLHALFVRAGSSFDSVQVSGLSDPTTLCTDDVTVGVPEPYDPEGATQP
jgi:hypothetical protein